MREQRTIFGEVAELYDRARAGYPDGLIHDVLAHAGWVAGSRLRALEIGAGTAKATVAFAAHDVDVLALEPDAAMAAVLSRNCRDFPHIRVELTTFEDWAASESGFDLAVLGAGLALGSPRRPAPTCERGSPKRRDHRPYLAPH